MGKSPSGIVPLANLVFLHAAFSHTLSVPEDIFYDLARRCYSISCLPQLCVFETRDMYHNIGPLDPERLNVFRTVREITGEVASPLKHLNEEKRLLCRSCVYLFSDYYRPSGINNPSSPNLFCPIKVPHTVEPNG